MTEKVKALLENYPSVLELPVLWGHMDAEQHVNNVRYMRYLESGRVEYFSHLTDAWFTNNIRPILGAVNCEYRFPLTYPDTVYIGTRVVTEKFGKHSFNMEQVVVSKRWELVAARGTARLVFFDFEKQVKALMPESVKEMIIGYQG